MATDLATRLTDAMVDLFDVAGDETSRETWRQRGALLAAAIEAEAATPSPLDAGLDIDYLAAKDLSAAEHSDTRSHYIPRAGASFSFVRVMPKYAGRLVRLRAFRGVAPRA